MTRTRTTTATGKTGKTRDKILCIAERLFAREGFDRVTLRQIARSADQRNVAAVQYHFGSKEGLLTAIVEGHQEDLDGRRAELLADVEARGEIDNLERLLEILVMPLVDKLDSPAGRAYLRIQAQGLHHDGMRPATRALVQRIDRQLRDLGELAAPDGSESPTETSPAPYRSRFMMLLLFHSLSDRATLEEKGRATRNDRKAFVDALSRSLKGLLRS